MMDCFAEEIIAVAMGDNMKKELCIRALKEAYELRKPTDGLIHPVMQYLSTRGGVQTWVGSPSCNA